MRTDRNVVNQKLESGMTVRDLIEALQDFDPESNVVFICDYGDISNTQQALQVREATEADATWFQESAYSQTGIALVGREGAIAGWECVDCNEDADVDEGSLGRPPLCPSCNRTMQAVGEDGDPIDELGNGDSVVCLSMHAIED